MPRRSVTILSAAALLTLPVASAASAKHGSDDRGGDDRPAKQEQRVGAGTVASFTDGTLVITLADGSSLSGRVTRRTEIECSRVSSSSSASRSKHGEDDAPGDDRGGQRGGGHGSDDPVASSAPKPAPTPTPTATTPAGTTPTGTTPAGTTPAGTTPSSARRCGRSLLVPGASVRKARVRGGVYKKVHLYR